jgi:hypothetical protein
VVSAGLHQDACHDDAQHERDDGGSGPTAPTDLRTPRLAPGLGPLPATGQGVVLLVDEGLRKHDVVVAMAVVRVR